MDYFKIVLSIRTPETKQRTKKLTNAPKRKKPTPRINLSTSELVKVACNPRKLLNACYFESEHCPTVIKNITTEEKENLSSKELYDCVYSPVNISDDEK